MYDTVSTCIERERSKAFLTSLLTGRYQANFAQQGIDASTR
jgi:hypothetical protein